MDRSIGISASPPPFFLPRIPPSHGWVRIPSYRWHPSRAWPKSNSIYGFRRREEWIPPSHRWVRTPSNRVVSQQILVTPRNLQIRRVQRLQPPLLPRCERGCAILWQRCNLAQLSVTLPNLGFAEVTLKGARCVSTLKKRSIGISAESDFMLKETGNMYVSNELLYNSFFAGLRLAQKLDFECH